MLNMRPLLNLPLFLDLSQLLADGYSFNLSSLWRDTDEVPQRL
jgi:hypothetical protein